MAEVTNNKKVYEGKVERDPFGSWEDCSPGLYIDGDMVVSIVSMFVGQKVRLTIEELNEPKE